VADPRRARYTLPAARPLRLAIDGDTYTLPEWPTSTWLRALRLEPPGCWWQLIPGGLDEGEAEHLAARLLNPADPLDLDDFEGMATEVLGQAVGMWFWAAHRLAVQLAHNWMRFDGWCVTRGFDPHAAPFGRVLAGGYAWLVGMCEKESQVRQLDAELWGPAPPKLPSGRLRDAPPPGWNDATEEASFMQAMGQLGGLKR